MESEDSEAANTQELGREGCNRTQQENEILDHTTKSEKGGGSLCGVV